jgi:hypothetical protein
LTYLCHSKPSLLRRQGQSLAMRMPLRRPFRPRCRPGRSHVKRGRYATDARIACALSMREKHGSSTAPRPGGGDL